MKKSIFICAALALAASVSLSSCQKEQGPAADDGVKSIALSINFGQSGTKAVIDGELDEAWSDKYKEYKSLDLFFTNSNNNVLYYYHATPDAEAESNGKIIWDGLTSGTAAAGAGVRFLGMEGINRVFVVANAPALTIATDEYGKVNGTSFTMSQLNDMLVLKDYAADKDQNLMIYAGATFSLEPVAGAISDQAGVIEVVEDPEAGQDYQANITIRPAVSRIEISNVTVQTEGDVYFAEDTDGTYVPSDETNGTLRVHYTGFNPTLVGVYASNVYRTSPLFPQQTDVTAGDLFATPSQVGAIAAGAGVAQLASAIVHKEYVHTHSNKTAWSLVMIALGLLIMIEHAAAYTIIAVAWGFWGLMQGAHAFNHAFSRLARSKRSAYYFVKGAVEVVLAFIMLYEPGNNVHITLHIIVFGIQLIFDAFTTFPPIKEYLSRR